MIETNRLLLREMNDADFGDLYAVLADSDIMKHYPYTFDEKRVQGWIRKNIERYRVFGFGLWAVVLKDSGRMIGDCGVTMQNIHGKICPEIGYHIRADFQRQGYATEAARACRDWTFRHTTFGVLYSYMHTDNLPSVAVAVKNGMTLADEYTDADEGKISVFAVTRDAWEKRNHE